MRIFMAIGGLLVATNFALAADLLAADLPVAPAPIAPAGRVPASPPAYNWTGFYLGLNGGYGFATANVTGTFGGASASASENLSGLVGGGQVGFNYQGVFGLEADIDGSSQSKTTTAGIVSATDKITYIGTVRGRIGAAFDRVFLYATGGGGYGEFSSSVTVAGFGTFSGSKSRAVWTIGAGLDRRLRLQLSQLESLNLPRRGARQVGPNVDPARIFPRPGAFLDMHAQGFKQAFVGGKTVAQHDEGFRLDQAVGILLADHRGFQHGLVRGERRFHFERRYPHAADFEHVVGTAAVMVIAVAVAKILVAGEGPFAGKDAPALDALIPITFAGGGAAHDEFADFAIG